MKRPTPTTDTGNRNPRPTPTKSARRRHRRRPNRLHCCNFGHCVATATDPAHCHFRHRSGRSHRCTGNFRRINRDTPTATNLARHHHQRLRPSRSHHCTADTHRLSCSTATATDPAGLTNRRDPANSRANTVHTLIDNDQSIFFSEDSRKQCCPHELHFERELHHTHQPHGRAYFCRTEPQHRCGTLAQLTSQRMD